MISTPSASSTLQSVNVTCTIHPDSTADQCVVMAMADDGVTIYRTGNKNQLHACSYKLSLITSYHE